MRTADTVVINSGRTFLLDALTAQALSGSFLRDMRGQLETGPNEQLIALTDEWLDHGLGAQVLASTTDLSYVLIADQCAVDSVDDWVLLRESAGGRRKVLELTLQLVEKDALIDHRRKLLGHSALRLMSQSPFLPLDWAANIIDDQPLTDDESECALLFHETSTCFLKRSAFGSLSGSLTLMARRLLQSAEV